ncbi:MAG: T9SS type A sorting domain-containing protein [Flavobacteriaceae bacterium]|nr:T9SS type A sorting domain-containing protein [Flavobacteriaceae bacterium]
MKKITLLFTLLTFSIGFTQTEIADNGGFESGDFTDWTQFPSGTQSVITTNPSEGTYCAELNNTVLLSASILKNANKGIGVVGPGQQVTITFDARGTLAGGGVAFAEFFSELTGGGTSSAVILGGGPLAINSDPNVWTPFSFTTTTGADVSGGVTLQLTATTGGAGSVAQMFYDNISMTTTAVTPTCSDGAQNGQETGVDCGGPDCDPCIADPTESAPEFPTTGTDFYIYSGLGTSVTNFNFTAFNGAGTYSEVDIESDGNLSGKVENLTFYGASWDEIDTTPYTYVHLDYYAITDTAFSFYLIDTSLAATICCGNAEEPRYTFATSGGDETLEQGVWKSVFIPLSHFVNYPPLVSGTWDGADVKEWKFDGSGTFYFDNIYLSTSNTLGVNDIEVSDFIVYPNPSQETWNVKTNNTIINAVQVFDILGKQVLTLTPETTEVKIDASTLQMGVYIAKIATPNGTSNIRLIKK